MIVILGLVVLVAAVIVGLAGVLSNSGDTHALTDSFAVFGYHVTGSTGTLFLYGIVIGAAGMAGLSVLLAGVRHTSRRGRRARLELRESRRETAVASQDRDQLAERQRETTADSTGSHAGSTPHQNDDQSRAPVGRDWRHPFGHRSGTAAAHSAR